MVERREREKVERQDSEQQKGGWGRERRGGARWIVMVLAMGKKMPTGRDWRCLHPRARDRDDAATPHQPYVVFIAAGPSNTICDLHPWRSDIGVQQWAPLRGAGASVWVGRVQGVRRWRRVGSAYYFSLLYIV